MSTDTKPGASLIGELGKIPIPRTVARKARALANAHHRKAEAEEYCGDLVDDLGYPSWLPDVQKWLPLRELEALGFRPADPGGHVERKPALLSTTGVSAHKDEMIGTGIVWVLHNDGLRFVQGRNRHVTAPGSWFLFDDYKPHEVQPTDATTAYVCVVVALTRIH